MKQKIIVTVLFLAFGVAAFLLIRNSVKKNNEENEKKVLDGMTAEQLADKIRPLWVEKWRESQTEYYLNDPSIDTQAKDYRDSLVQKEGKEATFFTPNNEVKKSYPISVEGVKLMWIDNGIKNIKNPAKVEWALLYWLPQTFSDLGINMNSKEAKRAIDLI